MATECSNFETIWGKIILQEGQEFLTTRKLVFTYKIKGQSLKPSRAKQWISKRDIEKAYNIQPRISSDLQWEVRGPAHVFSILRDKRIMGF